MGTTASINFNAQNGRITFAYKGQSGLAPDVVTLQAYNNLLANGYNCYASVATAAQNFQFYQNGTITGPYNWADSYVNQIWLNAALQLSLLQLLATVNAIPYNSAGIALQYGACLTPITNALNFGAINTGVALTASQAAQVNNAAGLNIASILQTTGWYLQILPANGTQRAARATNPSTLWYLDGGSVQQITLSSIAIQ